VSTTQPIRLEEITSCFEGIIPSPFCTCAADGMPNITYLSIVHRVDSSHVALSFQFFNKTRKNLMENPQAQVIVVEPETFRQFQLDLMYECTSTEGLVFDRMRVHIDAVASQTGMTGTFALRGADIFSVLSCGPVAGNYAVETKQPVTDHLPKLDKLTERLSACTDLDTLLTASLEGLSSLFGYDHSFVLVPDEEEARLFTVASRGFPASGVGSEVAIGEGIIGVAAAHRSPIRNAHLGREMIMSRAVRAGIERIGADERSLQREIPLPGLADVRSQLAVPLLAHSHLLGVLCLQSDCPGRFTTVDEQLALVAARHIAANMAMIRLETAREPEEPGRNNPRAVSPTGPCSVVKHYGSDDSVFIDDSYLVKGVPGRIFRKMVDAYLSEGRCEFTNKEIRLDANMQLPDFKDNLETRLILLRRRLEERCTFLHIVPTGRGRFRFDAQKRLRLESQL
jgi:hypothetical protein